MKIYFDCGTHLGEGLEKHIESWGIDESWKIFGFEANPFTFKELLDLVSTKKSKWMLWPNVTFLNKAVWVRNETLDFGCSSYNFSQSVLSEPGIQKFISENKNLISSHQPTLNYTVLANKTDGSSSIYFRSMGQFFKRSGNIVQKSITFDSIQKVQAIDFAQFIEENSKSTDDIYLKLDIERAEFPVLLHLLKSEAIQRIVKIDIEWHNYDNLLLKFKKIYIKFKMKSLNISINDWE